VPSVLALQMGNWHGGRGAHLGFSPVLPPTGRHALEQFRRTRARFQEFGLDYSGTFYNDGRAVQQHIEENLALARRQWAADPGDDD